MGAKFCGQCGQPITETQKHCGKCGWKVVTPCSDIEQESIPKTDDSINKTNISTTENNALNSVDSNESTQYNTVGPSGRSTSKANVNSTQNTNAFVQFSQQMSEGTYNTGNKRAGIGLWLVIFIIIIAAGISIYIKFK